MGGVEVEGTYTVSDILVSDNTVSDRANMHDLNLSCCSFQLAEDEYIIYECTAYQEICSRSYVAV